MFNVGFEAEFISVHDRNKLRHLLKTKYPKYKISVVEDPTIASTVKMPHRHEIVTPPLPDEEALELLSSIYTFLTDNECKANKTTGLHVNVSYQEKLLNKWLNPVHILDELDYNKILQKWDREKNMYCRPFEFYYDLILKRVTKQYNPKDWSDPYALMGYSAESVYHASVWKFLAMIIDCSPEIGDKYTMPAYDKWDIGQGKHVCINLHYIRNRGYIEYRMIGGANYLDSFDNVKDDIDEIFAAMRAAIKRSTEQ